MTQIERMTAELEEILASEIAVLRAESAAGALSGEASERLSRAARTLSQLTDHRRKLAEARNTQIASLPTGEAMRMLCDDEDFRRELLPALGARLTTAELEALVAARGA